VIAGRLLVAFVDVSGAVGYSAPDSVRDLQGNIISSTSAILPGG